MQMQMHRAERQREKRQGSRVLRRSIIEAELADNLAKGQGLAARALSGRHGHLGPALKHMLRTAGHEA